MAEVLAADPGAGEGVEWRQLLPAQIRPSAHIFHFQEPQPLSPGPTAWGGLHCLHPGNCSPKRGHGGLGRASTLPEHMPGPWALGKGLRTAWSPHSSHPDPQASRSRLGMGGRRTAPPPCPALTPPCCSRPRDPATQGPAVVVSLTWGGGGKTGPQALGSFCLLPAPSTPSTQSPGPSSRAWPAPLPLPGLFIEPGSVASRTRGARGPGLRLTGSSGLPQGP